MNNLSEILACPKCKSSIVKVNEGFRCKKCKKDYFFNSGRPCFAEFILENEDYAKGSFKEKINSGFIKKLKSVFGPPDSGIHLGEKQILRKLLSSSQLTLNLGSSSKKKYPNTINLDIGPFKNVDVIGDGRKLPFKNESFDLILIESVLEHIDEPEKVIAEAFRVLKKGGKIYISIPFVFIFHGSPNDFSRFTLEGIRARLENAGFSVKKLGILAGPSSTFSQILRYYLALIFSFNSSFLFSLGLNFFGWLTFPFKYLDIIFRHYKQSHILSNIVYGIGEK